MLQDYKDYEVVAVNDGSTDNSLEVLNDYKDIIRIVSQPNQGVASARNAGILHARGDYICFIDVDDYIEPNYLSLLYNSLEDGIECCFSGYKRKEGETITPFDNETKIIDIKNENDIINTFIPRLTSAIFKYDLVKEIMFDSHCDVAYEDYLFQIKLLSKINKIKIVKGTTYIFEYNKSSVTSSLNNYKLAKRSYLNAYCTKEIIGLFKDKAIKKDLVKKAVNTYITYICNCYIWEIDIERDICHQNILLLNNMKSYMQCGTKVLFSCTKHFPKLVSYIYGMAKKYN